MYVLCTASVDEAKVIAQQIGSYPPIRPAFTMVQQWWRHCLQPEEFEAMASGTMPAQCPNLIMSLLGWKEYELK